MKWSLKLGRVAGIDIFLHWTFLILVAWIFVAYLAQGEAWTAAALGVGFVLALFGCIVLHELGHALTAKRYDIETRDITLLPIGGLARLQRMPERPLQELAVAAAGPAVNVVIAGAIFAAVWGLQGSDALAWGPIASGKFFQNLMWANVALVAFNLIPAFPMDGGRMLRALLATRLPYVQATNIAASIGQFLAIVFAFAGIFWLGNPFLIFIALFVFLGATAEAKLTEIRMLLRGVPVRDAMITEFHSLRPDDPLQTAIEELLSGWQTDFPVVEDGRFRGMLRRSDLATGLQQEGPEIEVQEVMDRDCPVLSDRDMLDRIMQHLEQGRCATLPVVRDGKVVGLVTMDNLGELVMVRSALEGTAGRRPEDLSRAAA